MADTTTKTKQPLEIRLDDCEVCNKETTFVYMRTDANHLRHYQCVDCRKFERQYKKDD